MGLMKGKVMSIAALDTTATSTGNQPVVQITVGALKDVVTHICEGYETQFALGEARYRSNAQTPVQREIAEHYARLRDSVGSVMVNMSCWLNGQYRGVAPESAIRTLTALGRRSKLHPRVLATLIQAIALDYKDAMSVTVTREMADISLIVSVTQSPPK